MAEDDEATDRRRRRTQLERSSLSTGKLLQATADLIAERGYEGATLAEIGKRAGYSHGLVTRRFGSKANLVSELISRLSQRYGHVEISQVIGNAVGIDAIDTVLVSIREDAEQSSQSLSRFYALLFEGLRPAAGIQEFVSRIHREFLDDMESAIARGRGAGRIGADVDPRELAELMLNMLRGLAYRWLLDPNEVDFLVGLDRIRRALGALARPSSAGPPAAGVK